MSAYSHILTFKFKKNGEAEVELKNANDEPITVAIPKAEELAKPQTSTTEAVTEKKRSWIVWLGEGIGAGLGGLWKSISG